MTVTEQKKPRPQPRLEDYPHQITEMTRYADVDVQGHVNNKFIAGFFETGRVLLFRQPEFEGATDGVAVVLAHMEITFVRELHWPGNVEVGTGIESWGRSSFTLGQAVFLGAQCIAFGKATLVLIDKTTRRPRPLTDEFKAQFEGWRLRPAAQEQA